LAGIREQTPNPDGMSALKELNNQENSF